MTTLAAWKDTVVVSLITKLPLQTYETSLTLVENYLSQIGGWVPVDGSDPTGFGDPTNGFTEPQAADAIVAKQYGRIYACDLTVTATLSVEKNANLAAGLDDASVFAALQSSLQPWISNKLATCKVTLSSISSVTGTIVNNGI